MSKTLNLARILRKSGSGAPSDSSGSNRLAGKLFWYILGGLAAIALIILGINAGKFSAFLGNPVNLTSSLFFTGAVLSLFFAIPGYLNHMYLSNDLQILLTLPYTATQIIIAKLINVSGIIWGMCFIFTLPYGISYGITAHMGFPFFLAVILAFICTPLIVMSVISIVLIIIMFFAKGLRNKDTIKVIGAILLFIIIAAIVFFANSGNIDQSKIAGIADTIGSISNILPINFALKAMMVNFTIVNFLEVIIITAVITVLFILCTSKLYISGALAIQETSGMGGNLTHEHLEELCRPKSVFKTYLAKELRHVKREPAYLIQGFLYTILYPAIMLVVTIFLSNASPLFKLSALSHPSAVIGWCTGITMLVSFLASSTNAIACSAMSREGESLMFLKQAPVDFRIVLKAKQWAAIIICSIGSTSYVVIGGILLVILGYLPWWTILYSLVLNIGILFFSVGISMVHDIKKPNFTWESEAQMLKKCYGPGSYIMLIIGIILPMLLTTVLGVFPVNTLLVAIIIMALCVFLGVFETLHLYRVGAKKMAKY